MRTEVRIEEREDHIRILAIGLGREPVFVALRLSRREGVRLQGLTGQLSGAIPVVRQSTMPLHDLPPELVSTTKARALGTWAIAFEAGVPLVRSNSKMAFQGRLSSSASAWQAFLQGGASPGTRGEPGHAREAESVVLCDDGCLEELQFRRMIRRLRDQAFMAQKPHGLRRSSPISGFEAHDIHRMIHRTFSDFPPPAELDLAAARTALATVARPSSAAVAWYGDDRDSNLSAIRIQAARSYPVIADLLAEKPSLSRAVDDREPIGEALQAATGLTKGSLKRLARLRTPIPSESAFDQGERVEGVDALGVHRRHLLRVRGHATRDTILRVLAGMPADRTPESDDEFKAFHELLSAVAQPLANALEIPEARILESSKGRWAAFRDQLAAAADFAPDAFDRRTMTVTTVDAIEMIEDFNRSVLMPRILRSIEETGQKFPLTSPKILADGFRTAAGLLVGSTKNIASHLFEMARRRASRIPALMVAEGSYDDGLAAIAERENDRFSRYGQEGFPLLTDPWQSPNGRLVVPLQDFADMREESRQLNHCVGRLYLGAARGTSSHIFSIRDGVTNERLSTLELSGITDAGPPCEGIVVVQHRAKRNGSPSAECLAAAKEFVRLLQAGMLPVNAQEIRHWRGYIEKQINDLATRSAYRPVTWTSTLETDWADGDRREAVWQEWRGIIGGQVGRLEATSGLYRFREVRGLLERTCPAAATILARRAEEQRAPAEAPLPPVEDAPAP